MLGFLLSVFLLEKKSRIAGLAGISPIAVSAITLGLGYMIAFGSGQWVFIVLAHAVIAFPFAFRIIYSSIEKIPKETFMAARSLGADSLHLIKKVIFPLSKPAIASAFAFGFAVSLSELGLTMLLFDGKFPTMTVYIQRLISAYNISGAAAMGAVLIFFSGMSFYVIEKISDKAGVI